jgi:predicted RNA-binding protein with PUA-like domain
MDGCGIVMVTKIAGVVVVVVVVVVVEAAAVDSAVNNNNNNIFTSYAISSEVRWGCLDIHCEMSYSAPASLSFVQEDPGIL